MMNSKIAAFDFDNTLIDRDSLLAFIIYQNGYFYSYLRLLLLIPTFIGFLGGLISRQQTKERVVAAFFKDIPMAKLTESANRFAFEKLDNFIKPEVLNRLKWHQSQDHRCIIVSASPNIYLKPWAKKHGINEVLSSSLEVNPEGLITGKLNGLNCWGPEKVCRLQELVGPTKDYYLYAYGDSRGDLELLNFADEPTWIK